MTTYLPTSIKILPVRPVSGLFTGAWIARPLHWANTSSERMYTISDKKRATLQSPFFVFAIMPMPAPQIV